ncbi:MAG: hypothetical protein HY056_09990 [Proteobacteria bacterium]|nr:hypothetical protein [Pseudomonadota bacterium]
MRVASVAIAILALGTSCLPAQAWWTGARGNDIGGIIAWSPSIAHSYRDIAAAHCAHWNKVAVITSVRRGYGDYVGFMCRFPRGYDPVKNRHMRARHGGY